MNESNPYIASQVEPEPRDRPTPYAVRLLLVLFVTSLGCLLAFAVGCPLAERFASPVPALLAASLLPAVGACVGGIRNRGQLLKIAGFAALGYLVGYALKPAIAGADAELIAKIRAQAIAFSFAPASLLAIIGAGFACPTRRRLQATARE